MLRLTAADDVPRAADLTIRGWCMAGPKSQQRLKGSHRLTASIVAKDELVEVDLELGIADPVIRPGQPLLQVPDRAIGERDNRGRTAAQRGLAGLGARDVVHAHGLEPAIRFQAVR